MCSRVADELRGSFASFSVALKRSSRLRLSSFADRLQSLARWAAYFATRATRFFWRSIMLVFAIVSLSRAQAVKGRLKCFSSAFASASVLAVVQMTMSMPQTCSILSKLISGKTMCSLRPMA